MNHAKLSFRDDELYFRDYLNDHPAIAKEYEQLKLHLWKKFEQNWDGYTAAKANVVARCTQAAKQRYGFRYETEKPRKEPSK